MIHSGESFSEPKETPDGRPHRESMEVTGPPASTEKSINRTSTRWSTTMDAILGITKEEGRRLTLLQKEIDQAASKASVRLLRKDCLKDKSLRLWDTIAWILNLVFGWLLSMGPMFAALLIQVVMNGTDGGASIEKALAWEVMYLLLTALIAVGRKVASGYVVRRVIYRLDVGLAHLASLADVGQCSVSVGRQAREARADRVARSAAKVAIEMPLDIVLHVVVVLFCLLDVTMSSWKLGIALFFTLAIAAGLGFLERRFSLLHSEIEKRLAGAAGKENESLRLGTTSMTSNSAEDPSQFEAAAFGSHVNGSCVMSQQDAHAFLDLEGAIATSRSLLRLGQLLFVGNAVLLLLYIGALHVMQNRSSYRPEALLERLLISIAAVFAFAKAQGCTASMNNALPQVQVIAHLQQYHHIINPDLVASLKRSHMSLKGASAKRIFLGGSIISTIIFAWLFFLLRAGGGLSCQPITASCFALPAAQVGPLAFSINQRFDLSLGGCVFADEESEILQNCYARVKRVETSLNLDPDESADIPISNLPPITKESVLSCNDGSNGIVTVLDDRDERIGQVVVGDMQEPLVCKDLPPALKDKISSLDDAGLEKAESLGYKIQASNPVPAEILAGGSDTSLTVRIEYEDWSGAPAFFETSFDKDGEELEVSNINFAHESGSPRLATDTAQSIARVLKASPTKNRRIRRGQMSGKSANAYEATLGVMVKVDDHRYASSEDTISMQLFKGLPCFDKEGGNCSQDIATEMIVLGSLWGQGEERALEKRVSMKLPKFSVPCSKEQPEDCFSAANLITSGRDGFRATISVSVIEDGDGRTRQDPDKKTIFKTSSSLKCEGSQRKGTLNCLAEVDPYVPPPAPPAAPKPEKQSKPSSGDDDECVPHNSIVCSKDPIAALPEVKWSGKGVEKVTFAFGPDVNTGGSASWTLWVSEATRSAVRFAYRVTADCGCYNRAHSFKVDKTRKKIQQTSGSAYPKYCLAPSRNLEPWNTNGMKMTQINAQCSSTLLYDRGHLVPANHLDHNKDAIDTSNFMINILPQVSTMNRQAWLETEEIVECVRDHVPLLVMGGAVFDESKLKKGTMGFNGEQMRGGKWTGDEAMKGRRRWFWDSHTGETPTYMWKFIQGRLPHLNKLVSIAFWMPNTEEATRANLDKFVVSVEQLEELLKIHGTVTKDLHIGEKFELSKEEKSYFGDLRNDWKKDEYYSANCRH